MVPLEFFSEAKVRFELTTFGSLVQNALPIELLSESIVLNLVGLCRLVSISHTVENLPFSRIRLPDTPGRC